MNTIIAQATKTDHLGNVLTLTLSKTEKGNFRVICANQHKIVMGNCSAYCGLHPKGSKGAKDEVISQALKSNNSAELAANLSTLGFQWVAK